MVDALKEIWRVLVPSGSMVDLRPLAGNRPLEIVANGHVKLAGFMDRTQCGPDDIASNKALARVVRAKWFDRQRHESFDYLRYWETMDEMMTDIRENWNPAPIIPETVSAEARRLLASSGDSVRVRIRTKMIIARYQKHTHTPLT